MDWLKDLTSNPLVQQVAGSFLVKPQPLPKTEAPKPAAAPMQVANSGMSTSTMMMIGGGVLALVMVVVLAVKK